MKTKILGLLAALIAFGPAAASAVTWKFEYTGSGVSASGLLFTTDVGGGEFLITGVSGQRNGIQILGLLGTSVCGPGLPGNTTGYRGCLNSDNRLFETDPHLTSGGFNFNMGTDANNAFYDGGKYFDASLNAYNQCINFSLDCGSAGLTEIRFSLERVPEPGTLALLGLGLAGLGLSRRRKV